VRPVIDRPNAGSRSVDSDDANLYLLPVPTAFARVAGIVLLAAAVGLTALFGYGLFGWWRHPEARAPFTSSALIFQLMRLVVLGFCAQAGWRLVFSRAHRPGALFSWPLWLALGVLLLTLTGLVTMLRVTVGALTERDVEVVLFGGGLGGWCLWLAWVRRHG
jgi:hypothetical protein